MENIDPIIAETKHIRNIFNFSFILKYFKIVSDLKSVRKRNRILNIKNRRHNSSYNQAGRLAKFETGFVSAKICH